MSGRQNLIYRICKSIGLNLDAMKALILIAMALYLAPLLSSAGRLNLIIPEDKLVQYITIVNDTKQVLDEPNAIVSEQKQKYALCQRIQAYQGILQLSEQHPQMENAAVMKLIAQNYLNRQQQIFCDAQ